MGGRAPLTPEQRDRKNAAARQKMRDPEVRERKNKRDRERQQAKAALAPKKGPARKLSPTAKAVLIAAVELDLGRKKDIAVQFGISETRLYQIMREHREHDPHDPYCRFLTAPTKETSA